MLFQAFAHALGALAVTKRWTSEEILKNFQAFKILGIAGPTAIEEIQAQPLAFVASLKHHSGRKDTVVWPVLELEEACVSLLKKKSKLVSEHYKSNNMFWRNDHKRCGNKVFRSRNMHFKLRVLFSNAVFVKPNRQYRAMFTVK